MEAQGERLLQDLVKQEKGLVAKVDQAKEKAKQELENAQAEAARVIQEARDQAEAAAAEVAAGAAKEAESVRNEIVGAARTAAEALEAKARTNLGSALTTVLEKVLP